MNIAVIGSVPESLVLFRGELIREMSEAGHSVFALAGASNNQLTGALRELGAEFFLYPVKRTGKNPFSDISTCHFLFRFFKEKQIDVVLAYTP